MLDESCNIVVDVVRWVLWFIGTEELDVWEDARDWKRGDLNVELRGSPESIRFILAAA